MPCSRCGATHTPSNWFPAVEGGGDDPRLATVRLLMGLTLSNRRLLPNETIRTTFSTLYAIQSIEPDAFKFLNDDEREAYQESYG